jgi:hypothetical protein
LLSGPHTPGAQRGLQEQLPLASHVKPGAQVPQDPPQPSGPQVRLPHTASQVDSQREPTQRVPSAQAPQVPPHPSEPHVARVPSAAVQRGVHAGASACSSIRSSISPTAVISSLHGGSYPPTQMVTSVPACSGGVTTREV